MTTTIIHGKNKTPVPQELQVNAFPYHILMGDWNIVGSSLKLWKNRSDVLCRYTPHEIPSIEEQSQAKEKDTDVETVISFSDEIWWEQLDKDGVHMKGKGAPRDTQSFIRGRNQIDPKGVNGWVQIIQADDIICFRVTNYDLITTALRISGEATSG